MNHRRRLHVIVVLSIAVVLTACRGLTGPLAELIPNPLATATPLPPPPRADRPKSRDIPEISLKPEPLPTATPAPEPIVLIRQGFGQQDRGLGYAFVVENPNPALAVTLLPYEIALFNPNGDLAGTVSGYVQRLLPDRTLGVAGTTGLDEGVTVAEIEVRLGQGTFNAADPAPGFTTERITFYDEPYRDGAAGVVTSLYPHSLTDVRVGVIPYNDDGTIIGGGFTYLNFIPPETSTGVRVSMTKAGEVAYVELHPVQSGLTSAGDADPLPNGASPAVVTKSGYGSRGRRIGYGFLVENPNPSLAAENTRYRVTAYDGEGYVLATDQGTLAWLPPARTLGVGGELFLEEGERVDRLDVQILTGSPVESGPDPFYAAEDVTYRPGDYADYVTGWIVNPYPDRVSDLWVSAIAYDKRGAIIGGGDTFLDVVRARHSSDVEVGLTTGSEPARVELYARLSNLSEFR